MFVDFGQNGRYDNTSVVVGVQDVFVLFTNWGDGACGEAVRLDALMKGNMEASGAAKCGSACFRC